MIKFLKKIVDKIFNGIINLGRKTLSLIFKIKRKGEETVEDFERLQRGEDVDMSKYSYDENEKCLKEFEEERHKIDSNDPEITQDDIDYIFNILEEDKVVNIIEPSHTVYLDSAGGAKEYNVAAIEEFANKGLFHTKEVYIRHEEPIQNPEEALEA